MSFCSESTVSPVSGHSQSLVGKHILRDYDTFMAGLRVGVACLAGEVSRAPLDECIQRELNAYTAGLRLGAAGTSEVSLRGPMASCTSAASEGMSSVSNFAEEEREYVLPSGVMERLPFQEALSVAHCRGRTKCCREAKSAELDDAADVVGSEAGDEDGGSAGGGDSST